MSTLLGPDEVLEERPFTHPSHTEREAKLMQDALTELRSRAATWVNGGERRAVLVREHDKRGRRHLLVVPDTHNLIGSDGLTAIGFFGNPRPGVDHGLLFQLEEELVAGMGAYADAGLLAYYDVELPKSYYGNLVLFSTPDVPPEWVADAVHRRAVKVSPRHYHDVRLHKGFVRGRLLDEGELTIERTKYFDFEDAAGWHAVRSFSTREK